MVCVYDYNRIITANCSQCPTGFGRLPDGRCLVSDECAEPKLNDCGVNAQCIDQADGYT